jgi:hypothetical protein
VSEVVRQMLTAMTSRHNLPRQPLLDTLPEPIIGIIADHLNCVTLKGTPKLQVHSPRKD